MSSSFDFSLCTFWFDLVEAALQEKLPQGWEKCFDSKSKRFYYKNHLTKTTQWHSPCPTPAGKLLQMTI